VQVFCCISRALIAILDLTEKLTLASGLQSAVGTHAARWPPLRDLALERQLSVSAEVGVLPKD